MEARAFCSRNIWLTGLSGIGLVFTTIIVFFNGWIGCCQAIGLISMLLGFVMFFRLGFNKRLLFDVEDLFSCIFHVFTMDLQYYLASNEFYEISKDRKLANLFYRLLLCGIFFGTAFVSLSLMDELTQDKTVLHPVLTTAWIVVYAALNLVVSAFLEKRYHKYYSSC